MTSTKSPHSDYPPEAYTLLTHAEERHFWFRGRNRIIRELIEKTFPEYNGKSFLEIGCGTGYVLREISRMGFTTTGMDMHAEGLVYARNRVPKAMLITGNLFTYKPKKKFDAVGIFDVIEHIDDDVGALRACAKLLNSSGMLFLTVPARPELKSLYDDISGHKRRYTRETLVEAFAKSGLTIRFIGYVGFFQYLPHLIMKRLMLMGTAKKDPMAVLSQVVKQPPAIINFILEQSFKWDMFVSRYVTLPFGTSLIVSAQKEL